MGGKRGGTGGVMEASTDEEGCEGVQSGQGVSKGGRGEREKGERKGENEGKNRRTDEG